MHYLPSLSRVYPIYERDRSTPPAAATDGTKYQMRFLKLFMVATAKDRLAMRTSSLEIHLHSPQSTVAEASHPLSL